MHGHALARFSADLRDFRAFSASKRGALPRRLHYIRRVLIAFFAARHLHVPPKMLCKATCSGAQNQGPVNRALHRIYGIRHVGAPGLHRLQRSP